MTGALLKNTFRSIRDSLGRYISILVIVLLGVGFFAGLSITEQVMTDSVDAYLSDSGLYDLQIMSNYGFSIEDIEEIGRADYVNAAAGYYFTDLLAGTDNDDLSPYHFMSYTKGINEPYIVAGSLPKDRDECLVDAEAFTEEDIGKKLFISEDSPKDSLDAINSRTLTITGLVKSPLYLSKIRGSTSLGDGTLSGFVICPEDQFTGERYYGCYVDLETDGRIYSDTYRKTLKTARYAAIRAAKKCAEDFYEDKLSEAEHMAEQKIEEMAAMYELGALTGMPVVADVDQMLNEAIVNARSQVPKPQIIDLDRGVNAGYKSFENDVTIVSAIAKVFPFFFFLVAALVTASTMSRMMEEERLHMGVLLSMGYKRSAILTKYFIYSGTAGIIGWFLGIEIGRRLIPYAVWLGYGSLYDFSDKVIFTGDTGLFLFCLVVALLVTAGVSLVFGRGELINTPATLIRPKAPKAGKKILLERMGFIWNKMSFLRKVSFRNLFRYKVRSAMMIIGVAGCTALMVAGFGIRKSFPILSELQYGEDGIYKYDAVINFAEGIKDDEAAGNAGERTEEDASDTSAEADTKGESQLTKKTLSRRLDKDFSDQIEKYTFLSAHLGTLEYENNENELLIKAFTDSGNYKDFIDFESEDGEEISLPEKGQILIDKGYARKYGIMAGDRIKVYGDDKDHPAILKVSDVYRNHLGNGIYINIEDVKEIFGSDEITSAYVIYKRQMEESDAGTGTDNVGDTGSAGNNVSDKDTEKITAKLLSADYIASVSELSTERKQFDSSMEAINLIIIVVIIAAGMLAFVVIYNLTNINLTERRREIATIQVLGFRDNELLTYVFRENNILAAIGGLLGLVLGKLLFDFIIDNINVAAIVMVKDINPPAFIAAFIFTMIFSGLMRVFMRNKVCSIDMAEALKDRE